MTYLGPLETDFLFCKRAWADNHTNSCQARNHRCTCWGLEGKVALFGSFARRVKGTVSPDDRFWFTRQIQPWGSCVWVSECAGGRLSSCGNITFSLGLPSCSWEAFSLPISPTPATTFSFILKLNQFGAKHILKCQPTYFVHRMRNARFSENAMFGLDFVLECETEQMLDPPGVPWRWNEEERESHWWELSAVFLHILW